ncbi:hypothetical protein FSP39_003530 [Pinctada imbricata]|uniref:Uncharacterized protein n=1 Tax=Pinctada imbricata TaxID=66713 RepID=A0AA88XCL8_PINIB|nr:hypothetical protein FSP39_003530 [Pinctada imbricata]
MIERYGKSSGPVYDDCLCKPGDVSSINQTLPSYCYSPSGTDCDWYRNCLEKRHPCDGTEASYAIKYAKKFCDLYTENYNKFSSIGKNWVDQVRMCLQVQLVPSLRPGKQQTCESIKELAFRSHVPCYVKPSESKTLSFCNIPTKDQLKVFWTIKGAFVDEPVASMKGLFETLETCTINYIQRKLS